MPGERTLPPIGAIADPQVMALVRSLRREWKNLGLVKRGERLRELAKRGCSTRGLQMVLRQSPTSIRRHMALAGLPEAEREAVKAGLSAKNILARKASADRLRRAKERVAVDDKTGELSNRLADIIIAFCRTVEGIPPSPIEERALDQFLGELRNELIRLGKAGVGPARLSKRLSLKERFERTRPPVRQNQLLIVHHVEWLAQLLRAEAREAPILERAIEKAARRHDELRIKMTPKERYQEGTKLRAEKSASPPRRRF